MQETVNKRANDHVTKAGEVSRQLVLAGIAIVWLAHTASLGNGQIAFGKPLDPMLASAIFWFTLSLCCEVLHYAVGIVCYGGLTISKRGNDDASQHGWVSVVLFLIVLAKLITMAGGYFFIGLYVWLSPLMLGFRQSTTV